MEHIRRQGHRVNVMSLCSRDGLTAENFDDVELREIMAIRLLEAKAPGVFQVKKRDDGQPVAECRFCGPLKRVKLFRGQHQWSLEWKATCYSIKIGSANNN